MYKIAFALIIAAVAPSGLIAKGARTGPTNARKHQRAGVLPASATAARKAASVARGAALNARERARAGTATPKVATGRAPKSRSQASVTFTNGTSLPIVRGRDRAGQEYYDPNGSGNPLLDTSGAHRLKPLSDNFTVDEVARSGGTTFEVARIDPRQIACLQRIRDHVGRPVRIRSGYRSFWHNLEIYRQRGKRPTRSQHTSGRASDIKIDGLTGLQIAKAAIDACGPNIAIGLGPEYAHVDVRGDAGVWKYKGITDQQVAEVERYRAARRAAEQGRGRRQRRGNVSKRA